MAGLPSIKADTPDFAASSSSKSPPWNALHASKPTNARRVPPTALQSSQDNLSPPQLEERASLVGDYGDNKYLEQLTPLTRRSSVSPTGDDPLVQVGAGFSGASDASGLGVWDTRSTGGESISLRSNAGPGSTLSDLIRGRSQEVDSAEERTFYAISDLEEVVTPATARQELGDIPDLDAIIDQIFVPRMVSGHKTRLFKTFVIVTLMGKPEAIQEFIEDDIYDLDLPFQRTTTEGATKTKDHYIRNPQIPGRNRSDVGTFKRWPATDIESFTQKQHQVCVPIFDFDTQQGAPVSHYNLHGQTIIPFIENEAHSACSAGRSDVWRVKIHPAHTICKAFAPNMSLAIKRLKPRTGKPFTEESEKFIKEARNLRRFASRDHDFIIKLLCTFQWRDEYYFLFPWADGNLYDFWYRHPDPLAPLGQPSTARWFSRQCLGLGTALRDIHRGDSHSILHLTPRHKKHGKHGDLKPENILYFLSSDASENDATIDKACSAHLKISDLGEAEFHSTTSVEVDARGLLHTPSYSAPELRVKETSMPNYDVFSLACVLLEFVTWYIHGFQGVNSFSERRVKEQEAPVYNFHIGDLKVDSFFKHVYLHWVDVRHKGAMHKSSVNREIEQLLHDENCSDYVVDLLVFIKDHLLRVNPENRADCDTIYKKFQELDQRCRGDDTYCVKKLNQPPPRTRTDRSLLFQPEIKVPEGKQFEVVLLSESEIKLELVDKPSHPPRPGGGSLSATSAPNNPPMGPYSRLSHELAPNGQIPIALGLHGQHDGVAGLDTSAEVEDAIENGSMGRDDISSLSDPGPRLATAYSAPHVNLLHLTGPKNGTSRSGGNVLSGGDTSDGEHGDGNSMRSETRLVRRTPSDKDGDNRGDRGDRSPQACGVRVKVVSFFRRAFCCFL